MKSRIKKIQNDFFSDLKYSKSLEEIEEVRIKYLGKKGKIQDLINDLRDASKEEKPLLGKLINELKNEISEHIKISLTEHKKIELTKRLEIENEDISLPGNRKFTGRIHPIIQMANRMVNILEGMGFAIEMGPDLDSDYYNFEALNFPSEHPARDMQDTFYIDDEFLLRTHTSNVQIRVMEKSVPPIRVITVGRCFRNETISARSHVFFHQIEGIYIDKDVSFADLLATLDEFWGKMFNQKIETRYRPSYFPFVEPGLEGDIKCIICEGRGCKICKGSGWLEVIGAGMIHPNVLRYGKIDSEKYSGYAWGLGIERLTMLYYGIDDIRIFTENDIRFLRQF